jgi:hypothetical protein
MGEVRFLPRILMVAGSAAVLTGLLPVATASAVLPPKPTSSCKVPVLSVSTLKVKAGSIITVSGRNFSGCSAQGNPVGPTRVLTVKVGVVTAAKKTDILATTRTTVSGTFSASVTVPRLASGGVPKLVLAAAAVDPATKLSYAGVAVLAYGAGAPAVPAVLPPKPSPSCKVPVFSVSTLKVKPGSIITVSGQNFSGCSAQGSTAVPIRVLTVKVGVVTAAKKTDMLATAKTSATGAFSARVTVPRLSAGGVQKLVLVAAAVDPATKLTYAGVAALGYDGGAISVISANVTPPSGGGIPTAVPAGTGGQAATAGDSTRNEQLAMIGLGGVLTAAGGLGLRRRGRRVH